MTETYGSMFDVVDQLVGKDVTIFDGATAIRGKLIENGEAITVLEARDGLVYYSLYKITGVKVHADPAETFGAPTPREQILEHTGMGQSKDHEFVSATGGDHARCDVCGDWEYMH